MWRGVGGDRAVRIARQFHRIWVGPNPLPEEAKEFGRRWLELHPGWSMKLWTEENLPPLVNAAVLRKTAHMAPRTQLQTWADVARLEILLEHGGIYLDVDMEPRRNLEPLLERVDAFLAWETDDVWLNNAIMGCTPGHPFFARLVHQLPASVVAGGKRWRPNVSTGPQFITREWRRAGFDVETFPSRLFYPYTWANLERADEEFPQAYAVHRWSNRRSRLAPA